MENEIMEITNQETMDEAVDVAKEVAEIIATPETQTKSMWPIVICSGLGIVGIAVIAGFIKKSKTVDNLAVKRLEKKGYVICRPDELVEADEDSDYDDEIVNQDTTEE